MGKINDMVTLLPKMNFLFNLNSTSNEKAKVCPNTADLTLFSSEFVVILNGHK
jgi:hypothetical protein